MRWLTVSVRSDWFTVIFAFCSVYLATSVASPISSPIPLQSLEKLALCPSKVRKDYDPHRIPSVLYQVKCVDTEECLCQIISKGEFRCKSATTEIEVYYLSSRAYHKKKVSYGCFCTMDDVESYRRFAKVTPPVVPV